MKFDYKAYERLFPREEAEKIRAELRKEQEQGNVLEEAEKPQAKQKPVEDIVPDPVEEESGVVDDPTEA